MATKNVGVQYGQARIARGDLQHGSLEAALKAALTVTIEGQPIGSDAALRGCDQVPDYGIMVINQVNVLTQGVFFAAVRYAPGSKIPIIATGNGGRIFDLQNADTPPGTDLVRGMLYGLVIRDNFVHVRRDFALSKFEIYLEWLLAQRSQVSSKELAMRFVPEVSIDNLPSVQRIVVQPDEPATPRSARTEPGSGREFEMRRGADAFEILKAAHFTDDRIAGLQAEGVDVQVRLEISFKTDGRKREIERADIAELLRDIPDEEITLYSEAGSERHGKIKRVTFNAPVEVVGDFFDLKSVAGALWEAYRHLGKHGYIDP